MIDGMQADDKIIAVLESDITHGHLREITECPFGIVDRLHHYFLSYKQRPDEPNRKVQIAETYGASEALEVIRRSTVDYADPLRRRRPPPRRASKVARQPLRWGVEDDHPFHRHLPSSLLPMGVLAERRNAGSHIHIISLARTARPRTAKKRVASMGETRMGRTGKK